MNDDRLAELGRRLQQIEDERAIERMIASYGPLADAGEAGAVSELWASDGSYDVEDWIMKGRNEVAKMVRSRGHQDLIAGGCAHFLGPAVVTIRGDDAVAVCESTLLVKGEHGYRAARAGANYFHLTRAPESPAGWQIISRITRLLDGSEHGRGLLVDGIKGRIR